MSIDSVLKPSLSATESDKTVRSDPFQEIPLEIVQENILSSIPIGSIFSTTRVCKNWKSITADLSLFVRATYLTSAISSISAFFEKEGGKEIVEELLAISEEFSNITSSNISEFKLSEQKIIDKAGSCLFDLGGGLPNNLHSNLHIARIIKKISLTRDQKRFFNRAQDHFDPDYYDNNLAALSQNAARWTLFSFAKQLAMQIVNPSIRDRAIKDICVYLIAKRKFEKAEEATGLLQEATRLRMLADIALRRETNEPLKPPLDFLRGPEIKP